MRRFAVARIRVSAAIEQDGNAVGRFLLRGGVQGGLSVGQTGMNYIRLGIKQRGPLGGLIRANCRENTLHGFSVNAGSCLCFRNRVISGWGNDGSNAERLP